MSGHWTVAVAPMFPYRATWLFTWVIAVTVPASVAAQEPTWSFRVGGGTLLASERPVTIGADTEATLARNSPTISIDAIRALECCLEVYLSALLPHTGVSLAGGGTSVSAGHITPTGFQVGLNYRLHSRAQGRTPWRTGLYVTPFVAGLTRDRSASVVLPAATDTSGAEPQRTVAFHFVGGVGFGIGGSVRHRLNDQFSVDVSIKWQHVPVPAGEQGRLSPNPVLVTGGIVIRLY